MEGNLARQQYDNERIHLALVPKTTEVVPQNIILFPLNRIKEARPSLGLVADIITLPKKSEIPIQTQLIHEVQDAQLEPLRIGEVPWYFLSGTGFFVKDQVDVLINGLKKRINTGEKFDSALTSELVKVRVDIEAFEDEYLKQLSGLKWNIGWRDPLGERRIIAKDYNDSLLESITGKSEREGVVHDLWFSGNQSIPGVEKWLQTAPKNSFAVIVSPDGWSGLFTPDGKPIRYSETQVYVVKVKGESDLEAYTFRYEANILQNEELQKKLGITVSNDLDQKERIKQVLRNVAFFNGDRPNNDVRDIGDVINKMEEAKGSSIAFAGKTFDEMREFLRNPQNFLHRHNKTPELIQQFEDFVKWEFSQGRQEHDTVKNIQIGLALTILKLNRVYREQEKNNSKVNRSINISYSSNYNDNQKFTRHEDIGIIPVSYRSEVADLQKRGGCAGGGNKERSFVSSMGSSRSVETISRGLSLSEDYNIDRDGTCVVCNEGPIKVGPCNICGPCDEKLGGKASRKQ